MRNYKKKTDRGTTPKETYAEAAKEVLAGSSLRKAADKYGVNFMTLQRFCSRMKANDTGKSCINNYELRNENKLIEYYYLSVYA